MLEPLPASGEVAALELRPAKLGDRFVAYVLDAVPCAAGYLGTLYSGRLLPARAAVLWAGLYLLYQFLGNLAGGTPGKRLMGLRVIGKDGRALGPVRAFLRALGYALSTPFFNFGFVLAFLHPESRALHDLLSGSLVVEAYPKSRGEAVILFVAGAAMLVAMSFGTILVYREKPTPQDFAAVAKAREGLLILSQVEEASRSKSGSYTNSLQELAEASGDVGQFASAMAALFDPARFRLEASASRYRITAHAKDRKGTTVSVEGPPPRLSP